jgi:hypothetical protein
MGFSPFESVGDYPKMLNRIAVSTFSASILAIIVLRWQVSGVDTALQPLSVSIPITSGFSLPFGTFLPAFALALLSRIFKLHDRISDALLIRYRFDVAEILFPLAIGSGAALNCHQIRAIRKERQSLMYKVFYKYASSTPGKSVIDPHYITMALDQWCWYWIVLESTFIALALALILLTAKRYFAAAILFGGVLVAVGILQVIRSQCSDYALQEVEAILEKTDRKLEVAEAFRAL